MKNILLFSVLLCLLSAFQISSASDDAAPNPVPSEGEVFRDALKDGGWGPEMVVLPTGSFIMGSRRWGDEKPIRTVTITRRIAMSRYEVTFEDYDRFADATTGVDRSNDWGWGRGNRPVVNVSQGHAKAYAAWLSEQTGKRYRLPSEAEWEYAARSGTTTRYSWGNSITCSQARYGRRTGGECSDSLDGTVAVGRFAANAFGLYDMHGNVWEWVEDCWHDNYKGAPTDGRAWKTRCDDSLGVMRGGSWNDIPQWLRSASRVRVRPSSLGDSLGIRLVQDLNPCQISSASDDAAPNPVPPEVEVFRDALKDGGEGPEMVVLPTGRFRMGDLSGGGDDDEKPIRTVTITRRIAMGRYEVTFAEYDRFALATGRGGPRDLGWGRGTRPVINLSQADAQAYAAWLSAQTGKRYRLPSEAEWEYAARAGTTTRYSWGNGIGRNRANCGGCGNNFGNDCGSEWDGEGPAPVGSFAANAFGLYDMHGNVSEWVEDCYGDYADAPTDGSARTGCDDPRAVVVRGGSWDEPPQWLRSAFRPWDRPSVRSDGLGFRLVQDLNP